MLTLSKGIGGKGMICIPPSPTGGSGVAVILSTGTEMGSKPNNFLKRFEMSIAVLLAEWHPRRRDSTGGVTRMRYKPSSLRTEGGEESLKYFPADPI